MVGPQLRGSILATATVEAAFRHSHFEIATHARNSIEFLEHYAVYPRQEEYQVEVAGDEDAFMMPE